MDGKWTPLADVYGNDKMGGEAAKTATFIAASRDAVSALLAEVERQRAEIEALQSLFLQLTKTNDEPKPRPASRPVPDVAGGVMDCTSSQ